MPALYEKHCPTEKRFRNELFVYESAFPHKPKLIEIRNPRTLVLERIDGIPYLDVPELTEIMIVKLAQAVAALHSVLRLEGKVLCHWDNQPKNILWDKLKHKIYLLDFEDIRLARPETDLAHLFLFWADVMNSNSFPSSIKLFKSVYVEKLPINDFYWKTAVVNAVKRFDRRRLKFGKNAKTPSIDLFLNRKSLIVG